MSRVAVETVRLRWREVDAGMRLDRWADSLSQEERGRALRFKYDEDRRSYVAAHVLIRRLLSEVDPSIAPCDWRFVPRADGKPEVCRDLRGDLDFSISHTRGFVVCAVARAPVGIDVEAADCALDVVEMADRFFAPSEAGYLAALSELDRRRSFVRLWTLKEAYLKATGEGLRLPLDLVAFDLRSGARILLKGRAADGWCCAEPAIDPGFLVALACRCDAMEVEIERDEGPSPRLCSILAKM